MMPRGRGSMSEKEVELNKDVRPSTVDKTPKTKVGLTDYLKIAEDQKMETEHASLELTAADLRPSAVDRGPGLPMYNAKNGERMVDKPEPLTAPLGSGAYIGPTEVTLPPEVLAQLQRIEDMLVSLTSVVELVLEKSTIRKVEGDFVLRNKPSDHQHG